MKRIIVPALYLLLLFSALAIAHSARATNMRVGPIVSPTEIIRMKQAIFIKYLMRNDSLYDAEGVKSIFTVRDVLTNQIVFQNEVTTPFIAAYTVLYVQSALAWIPQYAGRFRITVDLVYNQDVIPGDNSRSKEFRVEEPPPGIFTAYRYSMLMPYIALYSVYGEFMLHVPPRDKLQWLNLVGWKNDTGEAVWLAHNLPLPVKTDSIEYSTWVDWSKIGIVDKIPKDSVTLSVVVSDTTWDTLTTELLKQGFIMKLDTFAIDQGAPPHSNPSPPIAYARPQNYPKGPILREYIFRDSMPNVDLDSSRYNPGTVAGYAGDKNACVPASGANSMEWLEREEEALPHTVAHGIKRGLLSEFCRRANETGVRDTAFVKAKLHFADSLKLPIKVKWQSFFSPRSLTSIPSPITRFGHSAQNQTGGVDTPRVTMDWIVQEVKDHEDVELFYAWQDSAGNPQGSHAVTVSGIAIDNDRLKGIWIVDDGNQSASGGLRQRYFDIDDGVDPRGPVLRNFWAGRCFIHGAFSESYDSTVTFIEPQEDVKDEAQSPKVLHVGVSDGILFIASLPHRTDQTTMKIIDMSGKTLVERAVGPDAHLIHLDLRRSNVSHGSYLIVLTGKTGVLARSRFIF